MLNFLSKFPKIGKKRIYLDYASITPVDPRVLKHVSKISQKYSANPSSLYKEGVEAFKELERSRATVAKHLEAHADEIVFTSGGTESNNLAIQGVLKAFLKNSAQKTKSDFKPHIISSVIEHPAVRELLLQYQEDGICDITFIPVDERGIVDLKELKKALRPETILVTIMYVNNEIGTIQPIAEVSKIVRHFKKERQEQAKQNSLELGGSLTTLLSSQSSHSNYTQYPLVHTDACQAVLFCSLRIPALGVDMMTLDSAKFYGPRSVGALYIKRSVTASKTISAIQIGGSQEQDLRAGTENVAGISGFAYAMNLAVDEKEKESARLGSMRDFLVGELKKLNEQNEKTADGSGKIPKIIFNGTYENDSYGNPMRVPNNLNICVPGMDAEYAVLRLDVRGICVSSVTSCRSKNEDSTSYVVEALGNASASHENSESTFARDCGKSSLRITLGRFTTIGDSRRLLRALVEVIGK